MKSRLQYFELPTPVNSHKSPLFTPYDLKVWIMIVLTFVSAFTTVFILRFASLKVRNFIIGRNVQTIDECDEPVLWHLSGERAGPKLRQIPCDGLHFVHLHHDYQNRLSNHNVWVHADKTWIEIDLRDNRQTLHASHDAQLWERIQWKRHCRLVSTWVESNSFIVTVVKWFVLYSKNIQEWVSDDVLFKRIFDPTCKCGAHLNNHMLYWYAEATRGEGLRRLLKESFMIEFCGMEIPRNHKYFDVFNHKTEQLFVAGIIQHLYSNEEISLTINLYKRPKLTTREYLE